jgi:hypothetical protein
MSFSLFEPMASPFANQIFNDPLNSSRELYLNGCNCCSGYRKRVFK